MNETAICFASFLGLMSIISWRVGYTWEDRPLAGKTLWFLTFAFYMYTAYTFADNFMKVR